MKSWAALLLLFAVSGVAAQPGGSVDATITITQHLTTYETRSCGGGEVYALPVGRGFTFSESGDEMGCQEVRFSVSLHPDATSYKVQFNADRKVASGSTTIPAPIRMNHDVRAYEAVGDTAHSFEQSIYAPGIGSRNSAHFEIDPNFAPGLTSAEIAFFFQDQTYVDLGTGTNPVAARYRFSSSITDIGLSANGIPLSVGQERRDRAEEGADVLLEVVVAEVDLPASALAQGDVSLRLQSPNRFQLDHIITPDGFRLRDTSYVETETQGSRAIVIPATVIAAHGPGIYSAMYIQRETLVVSKGMIPFTGFMLVVPIVAGVVADRAAVRLGRHTVYGGRWSSYGRYLLAPVAVLYIVTVSWIAFGHWRTVAAWPLPARGMLALGALALCTAGFLVIGYVLKRHLVRVLEREREETIVARAELERSNKDLEAFAYAASHDLQEPLRKIVTYNQLVQMRHGEKLDEEANQFLGIAVDAGKRMQNFIQGLLQYSRAGSADLPREDVECDEVVLEVLADLEGLLVDADAEIKHDNLPVIRAPRSHVRALFQNLLQNAVRYRDPERRLVVHISAMRTDDAWRFEVKDNGPGIEERDQARIFEPFTRGRTGRDGSGLGLAICRRIVEYGGGRMGVNSTVGEGASFWFTWPDRTATTRIPESAWPKTRPRRDEKAASPPLPQ